MSGLMRIEAFIIHLDRAVERKANVERLQVELARLTGLKVHVLSAIDGKALSKAEIDAVYQRRLYKPYYPFELSSGEVACFLSHRKCWQEVVDRGLDAALIVEDDVVPTLHFSPTFALVTEHLRPGDYIRMAKDQSESSFKQVSQSGSVRLFLPKATGLGMLAQIVTSEAAARLLAATECFDRPVDTLMQMHWTTGMRPLTCNPPAFSEQSFSLGGTTIQRRRTLHQKLWAELVRPFYRFKMKRMSNRYQDLPRGVAKRLT